MAYLLLVVQRTTSAFSTGIEHLLSQGVNVDRELYESTIKTTADQIRGPIESPAVLVQMTDDGEISHVLDRSLIVVGSDTAADIKIDGRAIAAYHAEISHDDGQYYIEHLDGRTVVNVNGERVRESALTDGDVIAIGNHAFTFQYKAPAEAPE